LWRDQRRFAAMLATTWAFYPVIYYVLASEPRYAHPICWTLLVPAGAAVKWLAERLLAKASAHSVPTLSRRPQTFF